MVTWIGSNGNINDLTPIALAARPVMPISNASSNEYTVLVKNRLDTRSTLPITRRPSPTTYGSVANLLSSRTI